MSAAAACGCPATDAPLFSGEAGRGPARASGPPSPPRFQRLRSSLRPGSAAPGKPIYLHVHPDPRATGAESQDADPPRWPGRLGSCCPGRAPGERAGPGHPGSGDGTARSTVDRRVAAGGRPGSAAARRRCPPRPPRCCAAGATGCGSTTPGWPRRPTSPLSAACGSGTAGGSAHCAGSRARALVPRGQWPDAPGQRQRACSEVRELGRSPALTPRMPLDEPPAAHRGWAGPGEARPCRSRLVAALLGQIGAEHAWLAPVPCAWSSVGDQRAEFPCSTNTWSSRASPPSRCSRSAQPQVGQPSEYRSGPGPAAGDGGPAASATCCASSSDAAPLARIAAADRPRSAASPPGGALAAPPAQTAVSTSVGIGSVVDDRAAGPRPRPRRAQPTRAGIRSLRHAAKHCAAPAASSIRACAGSPRPPPWRKLDHHW